MTSSTDKKKNKSSEKKNGKKHSKKLKFKVTPSADRDFEVLKFKEDMKKLQKKRIGALYNTIRGTER
ncbi:MAG: hypothetical protein ACTSVU_06585 [Promethearchaeota archaeon]